MNLPLTLTEEQETALYVQALGVPHPTQAANEAPHTMDGSAVGSVDTRHDAFTRRFEELKRAARAKRFRVACYGNLRIRPRTRLHLLHNWEGSLRAALTVLVHYGNNADRFTDDIDPYRFRGWTK